MKIRLIMIIVIGLIGIKSYSQNTGISWQGLVTTDRGNFGVNNHEIVANQPVKVRFSIREGSKEGKINYQEEQETQTNQFGIINSIIGQGLVTNGVVDLSTIDWNLPQFLVIEIDLMDGRGYEVASIEQLLIPPYSKTEDQLLRLDGTILSISGDPGNSVDLESAIGNDALADDELQTLESGGQPGEISISEGNSVVLNVNDADSDPSNELQTLELSGNQLSISDDPNAGSINLGQFLDNENQDISTNGTAGNLSISNGSTLNLNVNDADPDLTNEIQDLSLTGNTLSITNDPDGTPVDLSIYLDDTNTQLTEAEVDAYVANNGFLTSEADGSTTNELQDLSLSGNTLSITNDPDGTPVDLSGLTGAFETTSNVTSNSSGDLANDDFVFGSTALGNLSGGDDDYRFFFDKSKGAFRSGRSTFDYWDDANVGNYSVAFGRGTRATGQASFAHGEESRASGLVSMAFGLWAYADGNHSVALGIGAQADGDETVAIGADTRTETFGTTAMGRYNAPIAGSLDTWIATEPLLIIGNGTANSDRSNALLMLKNGNTTLNGSLTIDGDNVGGAGQSWTLPDQAPAADGYVMEANMDGTTSWIDPSGLGAGAFATTSNVTSNSPGDLVNDDFVFGSDQLDNDDMTSDDDYRMFFNKNKGALRAGRAANDAWDDSNVGIQSVAFGNGSIASGGGSMALGSVNVASGSQSFAQGIVSQALGSNSIAMGNGAVAQQNHSKAIGWSAEASGFAAMAIGSQVTAAGSYATATGQNTFANAAYSMTTGNETTADAFYSSSNGHGTIASALSEFVIGNYNTIDAGASFNGFDSNDRIFTVGNGIGNSSRSNALTMLKNGNTTLNGQLTIDGDNVGGAGQSWTLPDQAPAADGYVMEANMDGTTSWIDPSGLGSGAFATVSNVTSNSPGDLVNDDFVFGSTSLNDLAGGDDDYRFFFDKSTGAFRAGWASGTQWDIRGAVSVAFGNDTEATGDNSSALGSNSEAFGHNSFAAGHHARAHGLSSIALGANSEASGSYALTIGHNNISSGDNSFSAGQGSQAIGDNSTGIGEDAVAQGANSVGLGNNVNAESFGETVIGIYNTDYTPNQTGSFDANDRLFVVGNGLGDGGPNDRRDALVMLKSGNTTLNGQLTIDGDNLGGAGQSWTLPDQAPAADGYVMEANMDGTTTWIDPAGFGGGAFETTSNVTSNSPGDVANDDFLFGSDQLENDNGTSDDDNRMFFDKSKGAFRVGRDNNNYWSDANVGNHSFAAGFLTVASGSNSAALNAAEAYGVGALAVNASTANGDASFASGTSSANGDWSVALGYDNNSIGSESFAAGSSTSALSFAEISIGTFNTQYAPNDASSFHVDDRIFVVGNGINDANRSDALIMFKSGNTEINGELTIDPANDDTGYTLPIADGTAGQALITDGTGNLGWGVTPAASAVFTNVGNVIAPTLGDLSADDFVIGSGQLDYDGDPTHDSRMFFDKSQGAFRVGVVEGTEWDNRGDYSFASGIGNTGRSYGEAVIGTWATDPGSGSSNTFDPNDRLFVVGNGTNAGSRSDAMVVSKAGDTEINGELTIDPANDDTGYTLPSADGASGQVMTTNGAGVVSWAQVSSGFTHYLGEEYLGGIIFYLYIGADGLEHGLVVHTDEGTNLEWSTTVTVYGADRTWDGQYNTDQIVSVESPAKQYVESLGAVWYLPSFDEILLLMNARFHVNNSMNAGGYTPLVIDPMNIGEYWSSTELNSGFAYCYSTLSNTLESKAEQRRVRAIRSF